MYREGLAMLGQLKADYRDWRQEHFARFMRRFPTIERIDIVVDVDKEEGLAEFWGMTFYANDWEAYLPIHWLNVSYTQVDSGNYGKPRRHFLNGLEKRGIHIDSYFWQHLQAFSDLIWEDLDFWAENQEIYHHKKTYT